MKNKLKKIFDGTFYKFIIVGIINTVFGTGIMFICYNLIHLNYWISSASNYIFGSILSYFFNKYFTFKDYNNSKKTILKFIINITICYLVAYGLAKPIIKYLLINQNKKIQENIAMIVGMGLFVICNYLGQRLVVFKGNK